MGPATPPCIGVLMSIRVAVFGAAGMLGREILEILAEREFDGTVIAAGTRQSMGHEASFGDRSLKMRDGEAVHPADVDAVILAVPADVAPKIAARFTGAGVMVIDASGAFRTDVRATLVLPEVNADMVERAKTRLIACPDPHAAMAATVLKPLEDAVGVTRAVISTYTAVVTAGQPAMDELWTQTRGVFVNDAPTSEQFERPIAFNIIPRIGDTMDDGVTDLEFAIGSQLKRLINPRLRVATSCVRVPVFAASGMTLAVELADEFSAGEATGLLRESPGIMLIDKVDDGGVATPQDVVGEFATFVSRLRSDSTVDNGLLMWITADDLRRGGALIAVEVLEALATRKLIGSEA
jgi:aspartate-semialdehyde dehydrogenase